MKVKFQVKGKRKAQESLRKLAKRAGIMGDDFVDYAAGVAQRTVVRNVQPFGLTGKAKGLGEKAIWRSLHNTFRVAANDYTGKVVTGISEAHTIHQAARNKRGRVGHKRPNRPRIKYDLFQRYGREVIKKVGTAKGGFADKSGKLKVRLQKWISNKKAGQSTRRKGARGVEWRFDNEKQYTRDKYVLGPRKLQRVLDMQERMLRNSLKGKLRRLGRL